MKSICSICGLNFSSRTSYGLCAKCVSKDRLREFDRVESAARSAYRSKLPASLVLLEWLSTISDFQGKCSFCREYTFNCIVMLDPKKGLTYDNSVPSCTACSIHYKHGFWEAIKRVRTLVEGHEPPKFIPQDEEKYREEMLS